MVICDVKFDTKDEPILQNSSQEPSMSSKYDCVVDRFKFMLRELKFVYNSGIPNYVDS